MKKDTVYIDADDEISEVADKVASSKAKVVALVLPKRCTILHSSVNMKILNKAAKNAGKQIVLITSEKALMPIAGASGLYVAKTLKSKPAVPSVNPKENEAAEEVTASIDEPEPAIDPKKPIGELAGEEDITIDESKEAKKDEVKKETTKKNKKLAVPNFDSFRLKLFGGIGGLILILILWYIAAFVMPRAEIVIEVERQEIPLTVEITASEKFEEDNIEEKTFVLQTKSQQKSESKKAETTGEKNIGEKASGEVTIYNCSIDDKLGDVNRTVPAGTGISSGENTYITQAEVVVEPSGFSGGGSNCRFDRPSDPVTVVAQNAGEQYNADPTNYKVSGFSTLIAEDNDGISGGTDETVAVVSQSDCDALKDSLLADSSSDEAKGQLVSEFEADGLSASLDTYKAETISNTCEPAVDQEAKEVTAKATFKYTLSGVSSESLSELITQEALKEAGEANTVVDTGLSSATITVDSSTGGEFVLTVRTTAITGVNQEPDKVKEAVAGKNARETADIIKQTNGVKEVTVNYSPFWVNNNPSNTEKIEVVYKDGDEQ